MNNKALSIILSATVIFAAQSADARLFKRKARAQDTVEKKTETPYEKFLKKKGHAEASGPVTIHTEGKNVWLEFPDSLLGRKFLLSNTVNESSSSFLTKGQRASASRVYQVSRTDSMLIFSTPSPVVEVEDESMARALGHSAAPRVEYAFPVKYRNADSTAVVVNASKLFGGSNKDAFNMSMIQLTENTKIYKMKHKSAFDHIQGPVAFGSGVGVRQNLTFDVEHMVVQGNLGFGVLGTVPLTADFVTTLILLPEREFQRVKPDYRLGLRTEEYTSYSPSKGIVTKKAVRKWDLSDGLTVYVDTVFSKTYFDAISDALTAWNPAFEKIGLGSPVKVLPYPADKDFLAEDPFISRVIADKGNDSENLSVSILGNSVYGGNVAFTISVPEGYLTTVRRSSIYTFTDVDPRYRTYYLSEDAVCDYLRSDLITKFGLVLGLGYNRAGSWAYSPQQLRDPEFTRAHGITASAMDGIVFNLLARPGDKERGVVTMLDRIGPYDYMAIDWLYGNHTDEQRQKLLKSKEGMPEYLYLPEVSGSPDPRALEGDLGNDPVELYKATMEHIKYSAANAYEWMSTADLENDSYRQLFVDWLWLVFKNAGPLLAANIGGVYFNETSGGAPKYTPVPEALQKQCVDILLDSFMDTDWLDADKRLLHYSGAYWNLKDFNMANAMGQSGLYGRFQSVLFAEKRAGSGYTFDEYLDDVERHLLKNVSKGELHDGEDLLIGVYENRLIGTSKVLEAQQDDSFKKNGLASDGFRIVPGSGVPTDVVGDLEIVSYRHLKSFRDALSRGRARAKDPIVKDKIGFLIKTIDAAFEKK